MNTRMINQPTLKLNRDPGEHGSWNVGVHGLDPGWIDSLGERTQTDDLLRSILRVTVVQAEGSPGGDGLPDVFGRCRIFGDELRFRPHFPFQRGVKYRASFDLQPCGNSRPLQALTLDFVLPGADNVEPTMVKDVFPSSDTLPENLLRFYVRFSNPMRRGRVEEQITLLGSDGHPAPDVLYRAPVELWDRSMRHLTILLDPGRLKRGVGPHVELGPPLKENQEYTLVIGAGLLDLSGRPLRESFYKGFRVTDAVREPISVERWKIVQPCVGTHQPLRLMFPEPLDRALLLQTIIIETAGGLIVEGQVVIDHCERRWSLIPTLPWAAGDYQVRVTPSLEDVCGNSTIAAFDRPLRPSVDPAGEMTDRLLCFHLE